MITDVISILTVLSAIIITLYIFSYWYQFFRKTSSASVINKILYILLILNLLLLIFSLNFLSNKFILYLISLLLFLLLPVSKKSLKFQTIISTLAVIVFFFTMLNYQYFRYLP